MVVQNQMEAIWTKLPIELTEKICNLLPSLHPLPPPLKGDIESGTGWLKLFANRFRYYHHMDKWYILYNAMLESLTPPMYPVPFNEFTIKGYCEYMWSTMTRNERHAMFTDDYSEFISALDARDAQLEEWNEARLNRTNGGNFTTLM